MVTSALYVLRLSVLLLVLAAALEPQFSFQGARRCAPVGRAVHLLNDYRVSLKSHLVVGFKTNESTAAVVLRTTPILIQKKGNDHSQSMPYTPATLRVCSIIICIPASCSGDNLLILSRFAVMKSNILEILDDSGFTGRNQAPSGVSSSSAIFLSVSNSGVFKPLSIFERFDLS